MSVFAEQKLLSTAKALTEDEQKVVLSAIPTHLILEEINSRLQGSVDEITSLGNQITEKQAAANLIIEILLDTVTSFKDKLINSNT